MWPKKEIGVLSLSSSLLSLISFVFLLVRLFLTGLSLPLPHPNLWPRHPPQDTNQLCMGLRHCTSVYSSLCACDGLKLWALRALYKHTWNYTRFFSMLKWHMKTNARLSVYSGAIWQIHACKYVWVHVYAPCVFLSHQQATHLEPGRL